MNTQEVAKKWAQMVREGKNEECIKELYADQIKSHEMPGTPNEVVEGKQNVLNKNKEWFNSVETYHGGKVSEPIVAGNHFTSKMDFDVTFKDMGRKKMEEFGVFEVKDGKIVNEQFFYSM